MEGLDVTLWPLTAWHWLALGLVLLSIEMMAGTFDLLWIAIAAAVTSVFTAIAPDPMAGWQGQLIVFAIASTALFILGRTLLRGMRENIEEHPTLNKRMASTIGEIAVVADKFVAGSGRVKLGDTLWSAKAGEAADLNEGDAVKVVSTEGNELLVQKI